MVKDWVDLKHQTCHLSLNDSPWNRKLFNASERLHKKLKIIKYGVSEPPILELRGGSDDEFEKLIPNPKILAGPDRRKIRIRASRSSTTVSSTPPKLPISDSTRSSFPFKSHSSANSISTREEALCSGFAPPRDLEETREQRKLRIESYLEHRLLEQGRPPPPPPPDDQEPTLEEDLALIRDVERQLRQACDAGDRAHARHLLQCGAEFDEWENATTLCAKTIMEAQWEVWESERRGEEVDIDQVRAKLQRREERMAVFMERNENESSSGDIFLDCQVTKEERAAFENDRHSYNRFTREAVEYYRENYPEIRFIQDQDAQRKLGAFRPGDEDDVQENSDERAFKDRVREELSLSDWLDPLGARFDRMELAKRRNATDDLCSEDQELLHILDPPCKALQDLMSESDSREDAVLITVSKAATEITEAEVNPWDKASDGRLSATFDRTFDVVDTLKGFEKVGTHLGVRSSDQTFSQVRRRFLNTRGGSYRGMPGVTLPLRKP